MGTPVGHRAVPTLGDLYMERMIPVRIACNATQIEEIAEFTKTYYDQLKVLYYCVSTTVRFV